MTSEPANKSSGAAAPLVIGDHVRVHTGEEGIVAGFIAGSPKRVHVLIRPGYGGTYFLFECEKLSLGADAPEGDANAWYSAAQIEEFRNSLNTRTLP